MRPTPIMPRRFVDASAVAARRELVVPVHQGLPAQL